MNCEKFDISESGITQNNLQNSPLSANASINDMNMCSCGCGFEIGGLNFIRLHVESQEEAEQREIMQQEHEEKIASEYSLEAAA